MGFDELFEKVNEAHIASMETEGFSLTETRKSDLSKVNEEKVNVDLIDLQKQHMKQDIEYAEGRLKTSSEENKERDVSKLKKLKKEYTEFLKRDAEFEEAFYKRKKKEKEEKNESVVEEIDESIDEEIDENKVIEGEDVDMSNWLKTVEREIKRTVSKWESSGAVPEGTNQVLLLKLATKDVGTNISMSGEMNKLYSNLKKF